MIPDRWQMLNTTADCLSDTLQSITTKFIILLLLPREKEAETNMELTFGNPGTCGDKLMYDHLTHDPVFSVFPVFNEFVPT